MMLTVNGCTASWRRVLLIAVAFAIATSNAFVLPTTTTTTSVRSKLSTTTGATGVLTSPWSSSLYLTAIEAELGLHERFDRWRFLQKLLDQETQPAPTNRLIHQVLGGYLRYPRPMFGNSDATGSPERTAQRLEKIARVLAEWTENDDSIPLTSIPQTDVTDLMTILEELLPHPEEEEDDHKGTWDTVIEVHGRESVKYGQQNPTMEWQSRCLAARLLIYYDFLLLGVVDRPLDDDDTGSPAP